MKTPEPRPGRRAPAAGAGAILLAVLVALGGVPGKASGQSWSTFQASRQHQGETSLRVHVGYGAGEFALNRATTTDLYQLSMRYDEDVVEPRHSYRDGTLRVGADGTARRMGRGSSGDLELSLTPAVDTDLRMEFGAVRAVMDLGGLRLQSLELVTGASDANLRVSAPNPIGMDLATFRIGAASFAARELGSLNAREFRVEAGVGDVRLGFEGLSRSDTRVRVEMGLGSLELRIPRGVGIEVERSTFLTSMSAPDLTRRGDAYYSPEWDQAERRIRVRVDAAIGSISVVRTSPDGE